MAREKNRDDREFDKTQLKLTGHGKTLHRDYAAHWFRWSFARRFITNKSNVLEVGCGEEKPLSKIITGGAAAHVNTYVGVDLNKLKPSGSQRLTFIGEFNFVERWKELVKLRPEGYDVLVTFEVLEHMRSDHQVKFLKGCFTCLKSGGTMLLSTPCYDGVHHAANHIRELTIDELNKMVVKTGFKVEQRFGTFMDIKHIGKSGIRGQSWSVGQVSDISIKEVKDALSQYFDNDAISNIFGPLYPDAARNNVWVCKKP